MSQDININMISFFIAPTLKLGASVTIIITVTGQMIVGILINNFEWFDVPVNPISTARIIFLLRQIIMAVITGQFGIFNLQKGKLLVRELLLQY